jgi:hypothetical protein
MPQLLNLINDPQYTLSYHGSRGPQFDFMPLGASTIHNVSSIDGQPVFSTYSSPYLNMQTPSNLDIGAGTHIRYMDNPPQ